MYTDHTRNVTYKLSYHFIWCSKYRKKLLVGRIAVLLKLGIPHLCADEEWAIETLDIQPDHVRLVITVPPSVTPSEVAHQIKEETARVVFKRFPEVKNECPDGELWSSSYYVGSVGDISLDAVREYIDLVQN